MRHIAFILDGNRRWAAARGLPALEGHRAGYENVKKIGLACLERGIEFVTVFAFSTENWKRSVEEVGYLMALLERALTAGLPFYLEHGVRLRVLGLRDGLSEGLRKAIEQAEPKTAHGARGQLNLCINYGGRAEIVEAVRHIAAEGTRPEEVTEALLASRMWTADIPDPDLIVRTSGEQRLSGFLTWSGVYSELLFLETFWPDFSEQHLDTVLAEYARRERRFGK